MESKHTKGEWFASGTEVISIPSQVKISNQISGENYEKAKANAKLIAAAPDLLEALKIFRKQVGITWDSVDGKDFEAGAMLDIIDNAIKKATS
jgi:hypothetical protein